MENEDSDRQIRKCSARWGWGKPSYKNYGRIYLLGVQISTFLECRQ